VLSKRLTLLALLVGALGAQTAPPIQLTLDLTDAPRKLLRARLVIPVHPGALTLVYPQWIPGEHGPTGPIDNLAGITFTANGRDIPWRRDDVNMFALHLDIPAGVNSIEARVDFLATAAPSGFSAGASTGPNLAVVNWNEVALYPVGAPANEVQFESSLQLPEGWKFGTALAENERAGNSVHFRAVSLETLVDSPVIAGRFFKEIPLAPEISPKHFLDMVADAPEDLEVSQSEIEEYSNLVREAGALYRSRHYEKYHFLLTLSDSVAHFGLEHHESSDDRIEARNFLDDDLKLLNAGLLPHEFTHSWNGKYRRPAGLATANYQQAMKGDLLWVYEGLTEYAGDVLAARSGLLTAGQYKEALAANAAQLDHRPGRTWRDLEDTAIAAQILYGTSDQWDNWRRSTDYYDEGELIWLDVDTTIRKLSKGKRSLNDFCRAFLGVGETTPPRVMTYTLADVIAGLNTIEPYDWKAFLIERLTSKSPRAPLNGIANGGYRVEYTDSPNDYMRAQETRDHGVNAWYSLGFRTADQTVQDVLFDSPAFRAGLGPGMKLVAINGRQASDDLLRAAIRNTKGSAAPIELITENAGFFRVLKIDYRGGEKYPHLVRDTVNRDYLDDILKPMLAR
jgi:predicted metalloprotease with PDZ domain